MDGVVLIAPVLLALAGCARAGSPVAEVSGGLLAGSCEPSALARSGDGWVVGDNETKDHLFLFDAAMRPMGTTELATPVEDIEALAVEGAGLIVVGSHSRNRKGEEKPDRSRILRLGGLAPWTVDLAACGECAAARSLPPNAGGFNIEGAISLSEGLVLGLRAPLDEGKARLLVSDPATGAIRRMVAVDLHGEGVRDLAPFGTGMLVVSGPSADADTPHSLWFLASLDASPVRLDVSLPPSTEGIWAADATHLRYVVDGSGKNGVCETPGRWGEVAIPKIPSP